ncbi:phosphoadenylyl-sulfate reductase [Pseudomonas sp. gcc21]|uniref:phosphoadenylyl-sulfate reductase n=1 Tax=Pseudomonas sp. gcc21 TaxID=2726989 RepID=UPI001451E411|nr:phosphoadenylyl-sulfate reductase [Pseudomonas sp. gcc21]QJD58573.1 phosphoadenylyl-sulfate reductase [Pseudomonas sp. gcc21]
MLSENFDPIALADEYASQSPQQILKLAIDSFDDLWLSFSGADDIVVLDMAWKINPDIKVFTLDTGRLHAETYRFLEQVRKHYGIQLEVLSPDRDKLDAYVREKGLFDFYERGHQECCGIRKIEPLRRKLAGVDAWITGQRKDQSPTRTNVPVIEADTGFSGPGRSLVKFNPLANYTSEDVWNYIRMLEIPYNSLHERGFVSIGCEPCTRPVLPNQHEREGRWWWEESTQKECGLHGGNLITKV